MFGLIKITFIGLLTGLINGSNHTKCVTFTYHNCMTQATRINLHPSEYNQEFHYCALLLNQIDVLEVVIVLMTYIVRVPNKTEDLNLSGFNVITGTNESKTLTKHISYKCKCKIDGRKSNSNQWWNNNKC